MKISSLCRIRTKKILCLKGIKIEQSFFAREIKCENISCFNLFLGCLTNVNKPKSGVKVFIKFDLKPNPERSIHKFEIEL